MFTRALPSSAISGPAASAAVRYVRPVSSESAEFTTVPASAPLQTPMPKMDATALAAGEAQV